MDENAAAANSENRNEEAERPVYSSRFLLSKELFYDFNLVSYHKLKKIFFIFLCAIVLETAVNLFVARNYEVVALGLFVSFIMLLMYLRTKKAIRIAFERNLISAGKESAVQYELFEDKIVSYLDELKREYSYSQITKLFETKSFILLHLQYGLLVTLEKNSLTADAEEVKAFLMNKCTYVKRKRFINCSKDKALSLALLIALIAASVVGTVIGLILKINAAL